MYQFTPAHTSILSHTLDLSAKFPSMEHFGAQRTVQYLWFHCILEIPIPLSRAYVKQQVLPLEPQVIPFVSKSSYCSSPFYFYMIQHLRPLASSPCGPRLLTYLGSFVPSSQCSLTGLHWWWWGIRCVRANFKRDPSFKVVFTKAPGLRNEKLSSYYIFLFLFCYFYF